MTLESRIIALVQAIGAGIKALQQASSGSATPQFIQQVRPVASGPWIWWQTDTDGNIIDLTINDGA